MLITSQNFHLVVFSHQPMEFFVLYTYVFIQNTKLLGVIQYLYLGSKPPLLGTYQQSDKNDATFQALHTRELNNIGLCNMSKTK